MEINYKNNEFNSSIPDGFVNMVSKNVKSNAGIFFSILKKKYPDTKIALNFKSPFELLIATMLSAQCTDQQVNIVTASLFKKYERAEDYIKVDPEELEVDIRTTGFYRQKTKSIRNTCRILIDEFGGEVPRSMEELTRLSGVARKTANIVLADGYGITAGIAVDTHVKRLAKRMGLTNNTQPEKIELDLMELFPKRKWTEFSHLLQAHGRNICKARKPACSECMLNKICPSGTV